MALGHTTLTPTNTPLPLDMIQAQWVLEIEAIAGFYDPIFVNIIDDLALNYEQDLHAIGKAGFWIRARHYDLDNIEYVALILGTDFFDDQILILFEVENEIVKFLDSFLLKQGYFVQIQDISFADFNQNGFVNLAVAYQTDNDDCPSSQLMILEFLPDRLIDISPKPDEQPTGIFSTFSLVDIDNDLLIEIEYPSYIDFELITLPNPETCNFSEENFVFEWNGERYAKVD